MAINNVLLDTTETIICQSGVDQVRAVLAVIFCNVTELTDAVLTVYVRKNADAAGSLNTVLYKLPIVAADTFVWTADEKIILGPSDVLSAVCEQGANVVAATATYYVL